MGMGIGLRGLTIGGGSPRWQLAGATADFDMRAGRAFAGGETLPLSSLLSVTRASAGTALDLDGDWVSFASDEARQTNLGLLIEEASTNGIRNNSNTGAVNGVIGSGGALPTNWTTTGTGGLTVTVTTSTRKGLPATRVRFAGTPSSTATLTLRFEGPLIIAAANGQTWTSSAYMTLTAGALTNVTSPILSMLFRDSGGTAVGTFNVATVITSTATRYQRTGTAANASTAYVQNLFSCGVTSGQAVDFEIEVAGAQLEQKGFVTSPILTTSAAVARAADVVTPTGDALTAILAANSAYALTYGAASAASTPTIFSFNTGQKAYYPTTSSVGINNGTVEAVATIGAVATTGNKVASAFNFDGTDFSAKANAGTEDNEVAAFGSVSGAVRFGCNASSALHLNGYLQRIAFSDVDGNFDNRTTVEPGYFEQFEGSGVLSSPWVYVPESVGPQIVLSTQTSGALVADYSGEASTASYPSLDMGASVVDMRARVRWTAGTANASAVGLIANPNGQLLVSDITTGPTLHIVYTDTRVSVGVFSGGTEDVIQLVTYSSVLLKDGTSYVIGWQKPVGSSTITLFLPDGTSSTVTDSRLATAGGQYATCEHFWIGTSGLALPEVLDFYAGTSLV